MSLTRGLAKALFAIAFGTFGYARAQSAPQGEESSSSVATKLQNPLANLTSVPLQYNFEFGIGPEDDFGYTLNLQPVIPFPFGPYIRVISRSILPLIDQPPIVPGSGRMFGLGDLTQSLFVAPADETGLIWGVGPVFLIPTATDDRLGLNQWGIGPTAVMLVQRSGWTIGALVNHIWSYASAEDAPPDVSSTFLQPFLSYTLPIALTLTLQTETTYDWDAEQWTVPLAVGATQVFKLGKLPVSIGPFVRVWVAGSDLAPDWSIRVPITFVLPAIGSHSKPEAPRPKPR